MFSAEELLLVERELCQRSLPDFVRAAWSIVEPGKAYRDGWHIGAIAEHLDGVFPKYQIRDLIITVPPRCMKSLLVSVFWPTWAWTRCPESRWIFASYAGTLSIRDATRSRRIIESEWFSKLWGGRFHLTTDQNQKSRFENDKTGLRIATSVGGSVTGEGGDVLVADDPLNVQDSYSKAARDTVWTWWREVFSTRRNDPAKSGRVIVMQRCHQDDLVGRLKDDGCVHLNLPMEAPTKTTIVMPSGREIVREEGALLWPEQFSAEVLPSLKKELGEYGVAAQFQQTPVSEGGTIVKRAWWRYDKEPPAGHVSMMSLDTGFKSGQENDWSVVTSWVEDERGYHLIDLWRGRVEFPELKRMTIALNDKHRPRVVVVEDKASGQSLIQELQRDTKIPVVPQAVDKDKLVRLHAVTPLIESGRVFLPERAPWLADFLTEFDYFPNGTNDDQVDSVTQALARFKEKIDVPRIRVL